MTTGNGWVQVIRFALPIMFGNLLQQLYNTVDGVVVGRYVSQDALAAVGSCGSLAFLLLGVGTGLSVGSSIVISQYFGARDNEKVRSAATTGLGLAFIASLIISSLTYLGSRFLLYSVMDIKDEAIFEAADAYLKIYAVGLIFQFVYNVYAAMLRSVGDSTASLLFLAVSAVTNIGLDLLFVMAFNWGVVGVAIATVVAQAMSVLVSSIYAKKKFEVYRFSLKDIKIEKDMCKHIIKLSIPSILQTSTVGLGIVLMQRIVNHFGKAVMIAFAVGSKVEKYLFVPMNAIGTGMSTFTGQNVGAGQIDRVKECWRKVIVAEVIITGLFQLCLFFGAVPVSRLFGVSGESLVYSTKMIRTIAIGITAFAMYSPTVNVLTGSGDAFYSMICSMSNIAIILTSAWIMVNIFVLGPVSICLSMPIGWVGSLAISLIRYSSGAWQKKSVVKKKL